MASTYLSRTPSTGVNRRTFTFSAWIKRARINSYDIIFEASNGSHSFQMATNPTGDGDCIRIYDYTGTTNLAIKTNQAFRDLSAWYHIVLAVDTTQATNTNRAKFYVNGEQVTSLATSTYPSQNYDTGLNNSVPMQIGRQQSSSTYFDGSMSHIHFADGQAYAPTVFGETDATTGEWKIKTSPSVTYGTNGFFILKDGNSVTDQSGNTNNFTVAGGTLTKTEDNPSNVFATWNPLIFYNNRTTTNGNTTFTNTATNWTSGFSTLSASQSKWYVEIKPIAGSYNYFGIINSDDIYQAGALNDSLGGASIGQPAAIYQSNSGNKNINTVNTSFGATFTSGDIIGMAVDLDNLKIYWSKDNVWQGGGDPTAGTGGITITGDTNYAVAIGCYAGSATQANFGNGYFGTTAVASGNADGAGYGIFEYAPPTGYYSLCTKNINTYG